MKSRGASSRCRGMCDAGHVTETDSPAGRLTWRGECQHPGCSLPIIARRVRESGPAGDAPPPAARPARPARRSIKKVTYRDTTPGFAEPVVDPTADEGPQLPPARDGDPAGVGTPAADPEPGPDRPEPHGDSRRGPRRERRAQVELVDTDTWVIPGVFR